MFNCIEVDGVRYLASDTNIQCSEHRYQQFVPLAAAGIAVFVAGIPLAVLVLLVLFRRRRKDADVLAWLGFLYAAYTDEMAYFELVVLLEKLVLTSLLPFFADAGLQVGMAIVAADVVVVLVY